MSIFTNVRTDADVPEDRAPLGVRVATLIIILLPPVGLIGGIAHLWGYGFGWTDLALLVSMYMLTGLGITVGYHRLFTHRSFEAAWPVRVTLAILGSLAVEGPLMKWAATHRRHHQHSDRDGDPHSPHADREEGIKGFFKSLWHAHMGWLFMPESKNLMRYVPDLHKDAVVRWISHLFPLWVLISLLIPTLIGGLVSMSWSGALLGFLWGGLVRILVVHHITWSINSVCHIWGSRPFDSHDHSRNNPIFGVLAFGEGWHNNHHAFPVSARHGLAWWQFDLSYIIIRGLEIMGLARRVRVPSPDRIEAKRRRGAPSA